MLATEFLRTIYLGDRACKSIAIDGWGKRAMIQVDEISRVRSAAGKRDYYNDENIVDGLLVFTDARSILLDPIGPIPNSEPLAKLSCQRDFRGGDFQLQNRVIGTNSKVEGVRTLCSLAFPAF